MRLQTGARAERLPALALGQRDRLAAVDERAAAEATHHLGAISSVTLHLLAHLLHVLDRAAQMKAQPGERLQHIDDEGEDKEHQNEFEDKAHSLPSVTACLVV